MAAGSGPEGGGGGEGRRIASKASMGSGRGEEAKLDNELDNYMKVGGRVGDGVNLKEGRREKGEGRGELG